MLFSSGTSAWGLIKPAGSSKCLYYKPHPDSRHPGFLAGNNCPSGSSPDRKYLWKLDVNNYLINEAASNKHAYFNYKVVPNVPSTQSRYIKMNSNNQHGEHCHTGPAKCDKLTFEYSTEDYKYFQIKQRTRRDCIGYHKSGSSSREAMIQTCGSIDSPVKDYTESSADYATWFTWEPLKQ